MCCRCTLTVLSDIPSRRAIFVFDSPSTARNITSRSRAVSIFHCRSYLLWVGYNQNRLSPERHAVPIVPHHTPRRSRDRTYFSCSPPQTQREIRRGRVAFFGQNFGDTGFVVGCCI